MENGIEKGLYKDGVVGPDQLPSFYVQLYSLYTQMEQPEKAEDAINRGIAMYPDNMDLLNTKIQTYLDKEDFEGALGALEAAAEKNPDNQLYFFNIGLIYQNTMNDLDKAMASFDRAIAIDSAYYDALYSKGVIYSNMSNDIVAEMNELPLNAKSKYKKLKAQKLDLDKQSVYWLEKAYEVKPEAVEVITALSKMYRTIGENEKALEMIQKLQSMETAE
jgi:tetratricopeptide (TPR) repeat protein